MMLLQHQCSHCAEILDSWTVCLYDDKDGQNNSHYDNVRYTYFLGMGMGIGGHYYWPRGTNYWA